MYGWRGRIGLIVTSTDITVEPEMWKMVPEGVSINAARMRYPGGMSEEAHLEQERNSIRAAQELADARPDAVIFACTSGSFYHGVEGEQELRKKLEEVSGRPVVTAMRAVADALQALDAKRVSVATPYPRDMDMKLKGYLESSGFEVLRIEGLGLSDAYELNAQPPEVSYRLARRVFTPEADAVFISCTAFRTAEVISALEKDVGRPVVTSNQASLWAALKVTGNSMKISGFGRLLEDTGLRQT